MGSENQQQFQENLLHNHQEQEQQQQRKNRSLRSKAAHFVSDVATVILNPISDKPLKPRPPPLPVSLGVLENWNDICICFVILNQNLILLGFIV